MKQNLVWASIYNLLAIPVARWRPLPVGRHRAAAGVVGAPNVSQLDHRRDECRPAEGRGNANFQWEPLSEPVPAPHRLR
jgi:hypothetical protein